MDNYSVNLVHVQYEDLDLEDNDNDKAGFDM